MIALRMDAGGLAAADQWGSAFGLARRTQTVVRLGFTPSLGCTDRLSVELASHES